MTPRTKVVAAPSATRVTLLFQLMLFFGAWILRVVLYPWLDGALPGALADLGALALRALIWIAPVALYLAYGMRVDVLRYLKLSTRPLHGLLLGAVLSAVLLLLSYVLLGAPRRALPDWPVLLDLLVVTALAEEIVFRGYVLRRLSELGSFWAADAVTALLSTLIYWPRWFLLLGISFEGALVQSAPVFVVALAAGYLVRRSNSLWPAVLLQATTNLLEVT